MAIRRSSIATQILMGVLAILFTIAILVGWSVQFTNYYVLATDRGNLPDLGVGYWIILAVGCLFLCATVAVLVLFLVSNVRKTLLVNQQNTFIDSVTHELKSPLASIRLCLDTMKMHELEPDMREKFVSMMQGDVERLQQLIEHILEASRLEERSFSLEPVVIEDSVRRCVERVRKRYKLGEDAVSVCAELRPQARFAVDRVAFETVVLNLLDNAVKYSDPPLRIECRLRQAGGSLRVQVSDQGIGLSPRQLKRVFRRFFRVATQDRAPVRGTGLGLYVVKSLVQRLGGRIRITSEGLGKGTRVSVKIPISEEAPADAVAAVSARG